MEIPMEKMTQILGELYLENRLAIERERQLIEEFKVATEQVETLKLQIENLEAKNG